MSGDPRGKRWLLIGVVALSVTRVGWTAERATPSPDELLAKLRALDSVYHAGVTFRGQRTWVPRPNSIRPEVVYDFVFTAQSPRHAFLSEAAEVPNPQPLTPQAVESDRGIYVTNGAKRLNIERRKVVYFDDQYSSQMDTFEVFEFDASAQPRPLGDVSNVRMSPWSSASWTLPYKQVVWCSGHGLSEFLNTLTEIQWTDDGLLLVLADGFESDVNPGTWELQLDPHLAYMARVAIFRNRLGDNIFEVHTSGSQEMDGIPLPLDATFAYAERITDRFVFRSAASRVDEAVLREARSAIEDRRRPNTLVLDARASNPVSGYVDGQGEFELLDSRGVSSPLPTTKQGQSWRMILIYANVAVVVFLVMWYILARHMRRTGR